MSKVNCPIPGCTMKIPRDLLMCPRHWAVVPNRLQMAVYRTYRAGHARTYLQARAAAIASIAEKEGRKAA